MRESLPGDARETMSTGAAHSEERAICEVVKTLPGNSPAIFRLFPVRDGNRR